MPRPRNYVIPSSWLQACDDITEALVLSAIDGKWTEVGIKPGAAEWILLSGESLSALPGFSAVSPRTVRRKLASLTEKGILLCKKPDTRSFGHSRWFRINQERLNELIAQTQTPSAD